MRHLLPLMRLFESAGRVDGRTKLQKIVYILQTMGFPFRESYKYHLHGPYSSALTHKISRLLHLELLDEIKTGFGGANRFSYEGTPALKELLVEFNPSVPEKVRESGFDDVVAELNGESSSMLETVATALFLERNNMDRTNLRSELLRRKPHLNQNIKPALEYIERLEYKGWLKA